MQNTPLTKTDILLAEYLSKEYLASLNLFLMPEGSTIGEIDIMEVREEENYFMGTIKQSGNKWTYTVVQLIRFQTEEEPEEWDEVETSKLFTQWTEALKNFLVTNWEAEFEQSVQSFFLEQEELKFEVEKEKEHGNS